MTVRAVGCTLLASMHLEGNRLPYLDSLRGVAILMVILTHVCAALQSAFGLQNSAAMLAIYSQAGVQLFFVVSAFSLCIGYEKRRGDRHAIGIFFIQRYFRIAPLYYLGIGVHCLLSIWTRWETGVAPPLLSPAYTAKGVICGLFFIHGFVPNAISRVPFVVLGGWSIELEAAFYVAFPLLFALAVRVAPRGLASLAVMWGGSLAATLLFFWFLSDGYAVTIHRTNLWCFTLADQLPVFMAGLTLYFIQTRRLWLPGWVFCGLCFAILTMAGLLIQWAELPYSWVLLPSVAGLSFVFLMQLFSQQPRLSPAWLQYIGRISFSIYIFHFVVIYPVVFRGLAFHLWDRWPYVRGGIGFVATTVFTVLVAGLTWRYVEKPGIALGKKLAGKLSSL
jgi:peptidoglycan/LPS O-acetylase OafA/YrhL